MRILKRSLPLAAAALLLGVATVFVLLAIDVRGWQRSLGRGDAYFLARPSPKALWQSRAVLTFDPARSLLGLDDALTYRQGLQGFWVNETGVVNSKQIDLSNARITALSDLQHLAATAKTAAEQTMAANLHGVMTVRTRWEDSQTLTQSFANAAHDFQQAIALNPANWQAKVNLELVLLLLHPQKTDILADARRGFGQGFGKGLGESGGGF